MSIMPDYAYYVYYACYVHYAPLRLRLTIMVVMAL